jgi:hypothetical protein
MANKKASRLIELGLNPVLLGSEGDDLKRPVLKDWQKAVYSPEEVAGWPVQNNLGIRCGRQRDGRALIVFDFDEEAERVFPAWCREVEKQFCQRPVIVASARGYHVYFFTEFAYPGRTLAGRYGEDNGRRRLCKFIETLGQGRQVVSAGSRHPSGKQYRFLCDNTYADIPMLAEAQYRSLVLLSRTFDERPRRRKLQVKPIIAPSSGELTGVRNCLDYARRFIGTEERVERNGDIRFLGHGGLLVTADGRCWYSFSDERGGRLAELIAWHWALMGEGAVV